MENQSGKRELRGVLLALLGAICWGFSATCVSWLTARGVEVPWIANMRMIVAGALLTAYALIRDRAGVVRLLRDRRLALRLGAYATVGVIAIQIFYMYAIAYTNPATALLLQEFGVPLVLLYTCVRARRRPTLVETIALALAVFGIVVISTQGDVTTLAISPLGLVFGLLAGVSLAGYNLIPVKLIEASGPIVANGLALLIGGLVLMPFVRPWEGAAALDATGWLVISGVIFLGTLLAYVAYLQGVADAGPVKASLVGVFEPVSGAVFSAVWLGVAFTTWDLVGAAAIIAMMVIVAVRK